LDKRIIIRYLLSGSDGREFGGGGWNRLGKERKGGMPATKSRSADQDWEGERHFPGSGVPDPLSIGSQGKGAMVRTESSIFAIGFGAGQKKMVKKWTSGEGGEETGA